MNFLAIEPTERFCDDADIVQGYMKDLDDKRIIFFYGTMSFIDIISDGFFFKLSPEWDPSVKLHAGFLFQADIAWKLIQPYLNTDKKIILAGHSLGGAIATILAYRISSARLITLAAPSCVGDKKFKEEFSKRGIQAENYCYGVDVVPRIHWISWIVGLVQVVKPTIIKENVFYRDHVTYYQKNDIGGI